MGGYTRAGFIIGITLLTTLGATTLILDKQQAEAFKDALAERKAPIAVSGDNNVYVEANSDSLNKTREQIINSHDQLL
jgi:hypothetical protein